MPVPGATTLIALIAHIGGPLLGMPTPDTALLAAPPSMGITIAGDTATFANGHPVHYRVTVHNPTDTFSTIIARMTFSSAANPQATHDARLRPASTVTYPVAGAATSLHLTAALTYATNLNTITTSRERSLAWLASLALGLLAVAGSIWLHRKVTPDLLTPANASHGHPHPEQP